MCMKVVEASCAQLNGAGDCYFEFWLSDLPLGAWEGDLPFILTGLGYSF